MQPRGTKGTFIMQCISIFELNKVIEASTDHENQLQVVGQGPPDGITVFLILVVARTTLYQGFPYQVIDWRCMRLS